MSGLYSSSRVHFTAITEAYKNYVALYKLFNNGSTKGVTPFGDFYWRMTYYIRYGDGDTVTRGF
jgi:hypothetical protein